MANLFRSLTIHYVNEDGKRVRKGDPGARKKRRRSRKLYGQFTDGDGILQRVPLAWNKEASRQMLADLVKRAEQEKSGLTNPFEKHHIRPLKEHVQDFRWYLESKGSGKRYVGMMTGQILDVIDGCGFKRVIDISALRVGDYLADRRASGMGPVTSNHYAAAAKHFVRWLVKDRRMGTNPLVHLERVNVDADLRHPRRALSDTDFGRLIEATVNSEKMIYGLSGGDRSVLYLVVGFTGLCADELASFSSNSFDLEADLPMVILRASFSKHRKTDIVPLHTDLVVELREWFSEREQYEKNDSVVVLNVERATESNTEPLWPGKWAGSRCAARMLRKDLEVAEIDYRDTSGRFFDFHALRGQFIASLSRNGVHP